MGQLLRNRRRKRAFLGVRPAKATERRLRHRMGPSGSRPAPAAGPAERVATGDATRARQAGLEGTVRL